VALLHAQNMQAKVQDLKKDCFNFLPTFTNRNANPQALPKVQFLVWQNQHDRRSSTCLMVMLIGAAYKVESSGKRLLGVGKFEYFETHFGMK
jgi:hypothetical protein